MTLKWRSKNAVTKSNPKAQLHMKDFQDVEFSIENVTEFYEDIGDTEGESQLALLRSFSVCNSFGQQPALSSFVHALLLECMRTKQTPTSPMK